MARHCQLNSAPANAIGRQWNVGRLVLAVRTRVGIGADDSGSAIIEFVSIAVLLLIPLVYTMLSVARVQAGAHASAVAAKEAARAFVTAPDSATGRARAAAAVRLAFSDQGLPTPTRALTITCSMRPCLSPGGVVTVSLASTITLPLVPQLGGRPTAAVRVSASHAELVDAYQPVRP